MIIKFTLLCELPPYMCSLLTPKVTTRNFNLRSNGQIINDISRTRTVFGESAFKVLAPTSCYKLQSHLKLDWILKMKQFKTRIRNYLGTKRTSHVLILIIAGDHVEMMLNCQLSISVF